MSADGDPAPIDTSTLFAYAIAAQIAEYEPVGRRCPGCGALPMLLGDDQAWCGNESGCKVIV
jgi:hypothetical protein